MKEVLSIVVGENESSKYWISVLNSLKNRGVQDILILCSYGLTGIKDAISTAFPKTEQQRCIVHMVRNTLKYVANKDMKAFAKDLKTIYTAANEETEKEPENPIELENIKGNIESSVQQRNAYIEEVNKIKENIDENCKGIYIISIISDNTEYPGFKYFVMRYELIPIKFNYDEAYSITTNKERVSGNIAYMSYEQLKETIFNNYLKKNVLHHSIYNQPSYLNKLNVYY